MSLTARHLCYPDRSWNRFAQLWAPALSSSGNSNCYTGERCRRQSRGAGKTRVSWSRSRVGAYPTEWAFTTPRRTNPSNHDQMNSTEYWATPWNCCSIYKYKKVNDKHRIVRKPDQSFRKKAFVNLLLIHTLLQLFMHDSCCRIETHFRQMVHDQQVQIVQHQLLTHLWRCHMLLLILVGGVWSTAIIFVIVLLLHHIWKISVFSLL